MFGFCSVNAINALERYGECICAFIIRCQCAEWTGVQFILSSSHCSSCCSPVHTAQISNQIQTSSKLYRCNVHWSYSHCKNQTSKLCFQVLYVELLYFCSGLIYGCVESMQHCKSQEKDGFTWFCLLCCLTSSHHSQSMCMQSCA